MTYGRSHAGTMQIHKIFKDAMRTHCGTIVDKVRNRFERPEAPLEPHLHRYHNRYRHLLIVRLHTYCRLIADRMQKKAMLFRKSA